MHDTTIKTVHYKHLKEQTRSLHCTQPTVVAAYSRGLPFLEQNRAQSDVQYDSLDLARDWLELQLNVVVEGHGRGISDHVDGCGG